MQKKLAALDELDIRHAVNNIRRGIEREALRINDEGRFSQADYPKDLGSALTHPYITTDYSEALLELITPPSTSIDTTFAQLQDIHKYVLENIDGELLWPMSMPCFIANEDDIRIAQYGKSNIGTMKTTYRKGLKNRYGSMMQAISGIHYNFSLPTEFFKALRTLEGSDEFLADYQSAKYMHMVRNIKRFVWIVTYLFGASPAMCKSFLQGRETEFGFEYFGKGSAYLPNATSLRMSDLGYTNSAQSALNIQYGSLTDYISKLREAIRTESQEYKELGVKKDGEYQQLNHNILQIENELYAPVRPKQVAESGEKPTDALENRGVMYVELRALDVNPFSPYGITTQQMRMLDVFLIFCMMNEESDLSAEQQEEAEANQDKVVLNGRAEQVMLSHNGHKVRKRDWLTDIFKDFEVIASWLDSHYGGDEYFHAVSESAMAIDNKDLTLSGKWLKGLLTESIDNGLKGMEYAKQYAKDIRTHQYQEFKLEYLQNAASESLVKQTKIEAEDELGFDEFLSHYFAK
jgi:glutamate--cysteine ligase